MLPSPTELGYFYEVATLTSFSHAAKKLNVTQPSLSMAIKRLEANLKTNLFYRQKTGVTLTPAGEVLFKQVKDLILRWDGLKLHVQAMHQEVKGRVTIGCNSMMTSFIANLISKLLHQYPGLEICLVNEDSQVLTQYVANASIDIAIVLNPTEHADIVIKKIINTDMTFWVATHIDSAQALISNGVVICDTQLPQTQELLREFNSQHASARLSNVNSLEAIADLTVSGCGVGILPSCFVTALYSGKLKRVENAPFCRNRMCMIYRYENKDIAAIKTVIDALNEFAAAFFGS